MEIEISEGIYACPENGDIEIYYPPECSCNCYCCDDPCEFCEAVQKRFRISGKSAQSYGVFATETEFRKFLEEYRDGEQ